MRNLAPSLIQYIDLNKIVADGDDCLMIRVSGVPDADVPVSPGDWIMLDRSLTPQNGQVVVCRRGETYSVQRFCADRDSRRLRLVTDPEEPCDVLGVVTLVIHPLT